MSQTATQSAKPRRIFWRWFWLVLFLLPIAIIVWLVSTETGLRAAGTLLRGQVSSEINWQKLSGQLIGPLYIERLKVDWPGTSVKVAAVEINWRPSQLLSEGVVVEALSIEEVEVVLQPVADPPGGQTPFKLPNKIELPVAIQLHGLYIEDIVVRQPESEFLIDHIGLTASWLDTRVEIKDLIISGPQIDLKGTTSLLAESSYPFELAVIHQLRLAEIAPIDGQLNLAGSVKDLTLEWNLRAPYSTALTLEVANPLTEPLINAMLESNPAELNSLNPQWPKNTISLRASAGGPLNALELVGDLQARGVVDSTVSTDYQLKMTDSSALLDNVEIRLVGQPGSIQVSGSVDWAQTLLLDLQAAVVNVQTQLGSGEPLVGNGTLTLDGSPQDFQFSSRGLLEYREQTTPFNFAGVGDSKQVRVGELNIKLGEAQATGNGRLAWQPALSGELVLQANALDPSLVASHLTGLLNVELRANMNSIAVVGEQESELVAHIEKASLSGTLNGETLSANIEGQLKNQRLELSTTTLQIGSTHLDGQGTLGKEIDFSWRMNSPDLSVVGSVAALQLAGSLESSGRLTGRATAPIVEATAAASELVYENYQIRSLNLVVDVDFQNGRESDIRLRANEISAQDLLIEQLSFDVRGETDDHTVALNAEGLGAAINLKAVGGWSKQQRWDFELATLNLDYQSDHAEVPDQQWALTQPSSGFWQQDSAKLERACIVDTSQATQPTVCVEATQAADGVAATFVLAKVNLDLLNIVLPEGTKVRGELSGRGQWSKGLNDSDIDLQVNGLVLAAADEANWLDVLVFEPGAVKVSGTQDGWQANATLPLSSDSTTAEGIFLQAAGQQDVSLQLLDWPVRASVKAALPDLAWIPIFSDALSELEGSLASEWQLSGTLNAPRLLGNAELLMPKLGLAEPGLALSDTQVQVKSNNDGFNIDATTHSGEGQLNIVGHVTWLEELSIEGTVKGEAFQALNTPNARVTVSPNIELSYKAQELRLKGELTVPVGDFRMRQLPGGAVSASRDQRFVDEEEGQETPIDLFADLKVNVGNEVTFDGLGLTAQFGGDLRLRERPKRPTTATGEIEIVKGQYQAYGQDLTIERGRVLFAGGPLDMPGLDIRAARQATPDILVGVDVKGTLLDPELSIFSNPSLPESDQLSYLILGRPLSGGSAEEQSVLQQAAFALGVKGGKLLTDRVGGKLGLDQVGIESAPGTSNEQAALVIGKYLSPKLYVSYGYGLFEPLSTLKLEYQLSKRWRVITESTNEATGGDFQWVIER